MKRIFCILKGTNNLGLNYPKGTEIILIGYSVCNFGGCKLNRKITTSKCYTLGCSLVLCHSKNHVWLYQQVRHNILQMVVIVLTSYG